MAVRQHLDGLSDEDLVGFTDLKGAVGRPRRVWALTAAGHARYPDNHAALTLGLVRAARDLYGEAGLERLVAHRETETRVAYAAELGAISGLGQRVARLAALRSAEGYMAEVEVDGAGGWLLIENHCSICAAASACPGFCRSELAVFRAVLGADASVERVEHLLSGGRRCVYRIAAAAGAASAAA
ncbi:Predicted transcriptional regulator [Polymorphum gilvum SL003B-26A1]|uniref:Predicted transcriptional regulator n=1 Tax=Polymorphum gilvum (strain LMG 25793 / CGMCC 1.9160 / SL003B-26A1) TaxID=991905 RepID=F2J1E6_POLGS|nr:Predicted transcriptional regulator [Polymorphum gilvum SL003B-26A1]